MLFYYVLGVGIFGAIILWWIKRRFVDIEQQRCNRIDRLKRIEPIRTSSPVDNPLDDAKEIAIESIMSRFSIIRKFTFIILFTVWILALIFPFLKQVPATFISILVGASGIILGIAARPVIENLISGVVISFSKPIRIGDTVILDDNYGTVEDITITHTVVKIWNWRRYVIPNSKMILKEIVNLTIVDKYQWTHVEFTVSYDSDIEQVKNLAVKIASRSRHFAGYETPRFWVMELSEKGYRCWIAAWADSPVDAWELKNEIRTRLIMEFKDHGIKTHILELRNNDKIQSENIDKPDDLEDW